MTQDEKVQEMISEAIDQYYAVLDSQDISPNDLINGLAGMVYETGKQCILHANGYPDDTNTDGEKEAVNTFVQKTMAKLSLVFNRLLDEHSSGGKVVRLPVSGGSSKATN